MTTPHTCDQGRPRAANRLAAEASPYLLQHAHNPVDWWAWGEEAFAEARRRDVPIFLSVGYSTCYWCHVMERESFERDDVAAVMNRSFVCVKLDREERPDVDELYMAALVLTRGHGGWPMNAFLEPRNLRPFWVGTYFPPEQRGQMPSWVQVLESIHEAWTKDRSGVDRQAERVAAAVQEHLTAEQPRPVGAPQIEDALSQLLRSFDRVHGGFGGAPKFPQPGVLEFLLETRALAEEGPTRSAVDEAITVTLDAMAKGGIFDHVGGGFHRYSVDASWTVPHFEKMLYDNAMLLGLYSRASELLGRPEYAMVAQRVAACMLRDLHHPDGAFFSALDAEVRGLEGLNYLWTPDEIREVLTAEDAEFATSVYGLDAGANFQDPHHPEEPARNVLRLNDMPAALAPEFGMTPAALVQRLDRVNAALLVARSRREQPRLDDKVIAAWNGMAIAGFARAAGALRDDSLLDAAEAAAGFLKARMLRPDGTLLRSWRNAVPGPEGQLEDYAFVIEGLLRLASTMADFGRKGETYETAARRLAATARDLFCDLRTGRWFDTRADRPDLFVRAVSTHDGAIPSAVSVMLNNLVTLGAIDRQVSRDGWHEAAAKVLLASLSGAIAAAPVATVNSCRALVRLIADPAAAGWFAGVPEVPAPEQAEPFLPVEVYAAVDRLAVSRDVPASTKVLFRIAEGYHLTAADPAPPGGFGDATTAFVALRIDVRGGKGVRVYADYPAGELFRPEGAPLGIMAYTGDVEIEIAVEREGEWSGRPLLVATYQACSMTECLPPRTVELDLAIDPA